MSPPYSFRRLVLLLALMLVILAPSESQAQETERATLQEAFATGDARAVLDSAASRVEISLFGKSSQYSRSQAVYVLENFFENHPPRRFAWQDTSKSGQNSFLAGRYWHEAAESVLRVHLRLRRDGESGWRLQEVRINRR